jgi:hypothetical protein
MAAAEESTRPQSFPAPNTSPSASNWMIAVSATVAAPTHRWPTDAGRSGQWKSLGEVRGHAEGETTADPGVGLSRCQRWRSDGAHKQEKGPTAVA